MTSKAQEMPDQSGSGRSRKILWRSGISLAAAAFLLASAPQAAQAQPSLRAPRMMVENTPNENNVSIQRPELAQNQRHNRAPDFHARDIRISAPLSPLPANDIKITAPLNPLPVNDIRIAAPAEPGVDNIRISAPINLSGTNQPQARAGMVALNQAQLVGPRVSTVQALQADLISASESTLLSRSANSDLVTVSGPQTFINWAPLDTANSDNLINILPAGSSLTFVGPDSGYTVLNRILPTGTTASGNPRGIAFGGNVTSRLGASDGSIGGNIWFYSPGGIVIGAGSTFDVGGLVLTTNDIDRTGGLFGAGGEIRFSGTPDSISSIIVENGATINALNDRSSYVAMVAPRIIQGGTINVDGSAAYVAAEQADLTINNGLFDIRIGMGTTDANGVVHSGITTGPSSNPTVDGTGAISDADAQAIYMVAVAKNDALTMLVSGSLGYQPAASASVINGNVVLSAGANVATTGDQTNASFAFDKTAADSDSNIRLQNVAFGSSVSAFATNGIVAATTSSTDSIVAGTSIDNQDLLLEARNQIDINALGGGSIGANGNVTLRAGADGAGGTININADQIGFGDLITSGLLATGNLVVDVSAAGLDDFATVRNNGGTGIGQDAVGGEINININGGGDLVVGGAAQFIARAQGGKGENQNGSGQGGNINLNISSGTFNIAGTTLFDAQVVESQNLKIGGNGPGLLGSDSIGGTISMALSGGVVTTGNVDVELGAVATSGETTGGVQSNDATSGMFELSVTGGSHVLNNLTVNALADARAGSFDATAAQISGFARSGGANFLIDGGSLTVSSNLESDFSTYGISAANPADRLALTVRNGGSLAVAGTVSFDTRAFDGIDAVTSTGGSISILADNAVVTTGNLFLNSSARPNNSFFFTAADEGRDFQAGDISLVARNGGTFTSAFTSFSANATGNNANAGSGTGGEILIHANDGSINFTSLAFIDASGIGGVGGSKDNPASLATGQGGAINFRVEGTGGALSVTDLFINADGSIFNDGESGAPSFEGDGGFGFGGTVTFDLLGGTFAANGIGVDSDGSGGGGGDLVTLPLSAPVSQAAPADLTVVNTPFAGGTPAGDGGTGQGGNVIFNLNGGNATVANLDISANGFGGDGADGQINDGTAGGAGGTGIGGSAIFNGQSGSLTVTSTLTVSAQGNNQSLGYYGSRGAGGFGYGSDGGAGGNGVGGTAAFNLDGSATINAGQVVVSTSAAGGSGGSTASAYGILGNPIQAGIGGTGGNATGGAASFNNNSGTMSFNQLSVTSAGAGGNGGNVFGFSGGATNRAGDGGTGTGGSAAININQDDLNNPVYVVDGSGVGGDGGNGLDGGNGGAAYGGAAAININGATAVLNNPTILANATAGVGGQGQLDNATLAAGDSGNGGNATGGTARLEVSGVGGNIDLSVITLQSDAIGGQGGYGYDGFSGNAGSGGNGGNAAGGRSELVARTGGTINLSSGTFDFTSTGTGGTGGDGGYTYGNTAGDGGDGGSGTGGTALFLAQGGSINGQDVDFTVAGNGGSGGIGGTYQSGGIGGVAGTGGTGTGGTAAIEVQEGSPGIISLASVAMFANGYNAGDSVGLPTGLAGRIELTDTSIDPAGLISLASLNVQALNVASGPTSGFFVTGNSGAMAIVGDLTVNVAGNIEYSLTGNGQMTVGGNASLTSGQDILIAHMNNIVPVNSIDVAGSFVAAAQGNFTSTGGSRINAASTASVRAEQNATVADIAGVGLVDISALFDVNVNNAAVTGTPTTVTLGSGTFVLGPQMLIQAGLDPGDPPTLPASYDPNYNATITGDVTSTGFITINAGGSAMFSSGSNTVSDNGLTVQTGDDIIIQAGARVVAGNNPATTPNTGNPFLSSHNLSLQAGSLTPLSIATITPIASIVAPGIIDANGFAVAMSANAIDGLGGTITASSLSADINDAPSNAVIASDGQTDDFGLLSAQCVEGNLCLGTLNADNIVHIGQASNNDVIQGIIESGTVSANDILVTIRRDILMGTDGIATVLDATNQFLAQSTEGNIDLRDASVSSASVLVSAANGSLLGSGSLTSANDIGISVAGDINAATIDTGGQLTTVALVGGGFEASYAVPGNITVATLTQAGGVNVDINAGGDISFGQLNLPANRSITLTAATGDVFLGSNSSATSISILGNDIVFNDLLSSGNITLNAAIGDLTGVGPGDLTADGTIDLDATSGSVTAGTINGGGGINIASGGDVVVGALLGGFTDILATSAIDIGSADTLRLEALGGNISLGTANITSNAFAASGALVLTTTTGAIGITDATTARATTLDAATDITIGNLAATGALGAIAGGDILFTTVAGDSATLNAGGNIVGGDIDASINTLSSNVAVLNAGGSVTAATINGVDGIDIDSGGDVVVGALLGGSTDILTAGLVDVGGVDTLRLEAQGSSISLGTANIASNANAATGALVLTATTGAIGITDATTARATTLDAATDISIGNLSATGALGATAGGNIALGTASGDSVVVSAGGNITGLSASAPTNTLSSNIVTLTAVGAINVNTINAADNIELDAGGAITADSTQGAFIDAVSAGLVTIGSAAGTRLDVTGTGIDIGTADITSNALAASGVINLNGGGGAATIGTANSARDTSITGASARLDQGNIAGNLTLNATAGDIDGAGTITVGGGIDLDATGNVGFGSLDAESGSFTVDAGGNISFTRASSSADMRLNAGGGISGSAAAAVSSLTMAAGGLIQLDDATSDEALSVNGAGGIIITNIAGNSVALDAGSADILLDVVAGSSTVGLTGGTITFASAAGGNIAIESAAVDFGTARGGNVEINSNGTITFNRIDASGNVDIQGGTLVADAVSAAKTGQGTVLIRAENGIDLRNISGNSITLQASAGLVNVRNNVDVTDLLVAEGAAVSIVTQQDMAVSSVANSGDIRLSSAGNLDVQGAEATGNIIIDAGGSAAITDAFAAAQSAPVNFNGPQNIFSTGGDITITAGNNILLNSLLNAANDLRITAGGLIDIQANVVGNTITTTGSDMNIGSAGSLGQTDLTRDIRIFSDGTTQMVLGGSSDPTGGFYLGKEEFSRIHSGGDLTFTARSTGMGGFDMVVQDLDLLVADNVSGPQSANIGLSNNLNFVSEQSITVAGLVNFSNANANSRLGFTAGQDLFINAASGVIRMTDANGNFSGSGNLSINAANIYAMTSQALTDIAGLSAPDIDSRLASNDGINLPDGLIRADNVQIAVTDNLLIQNMADGTDFADRRGFNVGSLSIAGPSAGSAKIIINGIVGGATGLAAIPATNVAVGFDPASTINGCVISNPASCGPAPTPTPTPSPTPSPTPVPEIPKIDDPVQDVIEEEVTPEKYVADPFARNLVQIRQNEDRAEEPLLDEPVTGAGNDDLWVNGSDCEGGDTGECRSEEAEKKQDPAE